VLADHNQHDRTARDLRLDGRSEVGASLNRLDVVKDLFSAEVRDYSFWARLCLK